MHVLILPISGGAFVNQLAMLQHLSEVDYCPDVTLASSGGNVAAYIAAAADWKWNAIERIAGRLSKDLFVSRWSSMSGMSLFYGYFKGEMYNKGLGVSQLLHSAFTEESVKKYEIWTGTYNKTLHRSRLFCNLSDDESLLDSDDIDLNLTQSLEPVFADGNIDLISNYCVASASIPVVVPPQLIDDCLYVDGGMSNASPISMMHDALFNAVERDSHKSLHMIYINAFNFDIIHKDMCKNILDSYKQAARELVRNMIVADRHSCYQLLRRYPGKLRYCEFKCNHDNLQLIRSIQSKIHHTLLELFPIESISVDLSNFKGDDVIKAIKSAYGQSKGRLWWLQNDRGSNVDHIIDRLDSEVTYDDCTYIT